MYHLLDSACLNTQPQDFTTEGSVYIFQAKILHIKCVDGPTEKTAEKSFMLLSTAHTHADTYRNTDVHTLKPVLLYLYRARNKITQLSIPTHAQLQRQRLKFIKKPYKKLLHVSVFDHLQGVTMSSLKSLLF